MHRKKLASSHFEERLERIWIRDVSLNLPPLRFLPAIYHRYLHHLASVVFGEFKIGIDVSEEKPGGRFWNKFSPVGAFNVVEKSAFFLGKTQYGGPQLIIACIRF